MARNRTKWFYVRLSCRCVRSVSQTELDSGTATCFGRYARGKEKRRQPIAHVLVPSRHIKPYRCDQPHPVEALDANGDPLYPMDVVRVLGTENCLHTVQKVTTRPSTRGEEETVLLVEEGPPILPGCTVKATAENAGPWFTFKAPAAS